jgi:hypothetical protein
MNWTWDQYKAAGKHLASYTAGGVTVAVAFGVLTSSQGVDANADINSIISGLESVAKGVAGLIAIITPIYTAWMAAHNASPQVRLNAVAAMPEVSKIITTPEVAKATPSDKVQSS